VVQVRPSVVVQTAGRPPSEPTAMNSCAAAVTACTRLELLASFMTVARVQEVRFGDHHSCATRPGVARPAAIT